MKKLPLKNLMMSVKSILLSMIISLEKRKKNINEKMFYLRNENLREKFLSTYQIRKFWLNLCKSTHPNCEQIILSG